MMSATEKVVNPDLLRERSLATFDPISLTYILDGSRETTNRRRYIENLVHLKLSEMGDEKDPYFLSHEELYEYGLKLGVAVQRWKEELSIEKSEDSRYILGTVYPQFSSGLILHYIGFDAALKSLASKAQLAEWVPLLNSGDLFGAYVQTEMGHGSHVRGLETTATYDPKRNEFVINSPTFSSTKFWPGNLGKSANHGLVMAQLYTLGVCHGLHLFLVPLRDRTNHVPLPGITVGDIGPKSASDCNDNGFLRFDNVRIPRKNMLAKHAQVSEEGKYEKISQNDKLQYASMVNIRAGIPYGVGECLAKACTIAIRYSCVRRQSELKPGAPEPQVLDYQTQQEKLFPLLATAYAYMIVGREMMEKHARVVQQIESGDHSGLVEEHATLACLKGHCCTRVDQGVEQCRLACGGHGYSHASGLPRIFAFAQGYVTAEGESTVMLLQGARFLLKNYVAINSGKRVDRSVEYLSEKTNGFNIIRDCVDLKSLLDCLKYRSIRLVTKAGTAIQRLMSEGKDQYDAFNLTSVTSLKAANAHSQVIVLGAFIEKLEEFSGKNPESAIGALQRMAKLYGIHSILEHYGDYLEEKFLDTNGLVTLEKEKSRLYAEIRRDAVAYVDAFDISDRRLASILGRYDGRVYDEMVQWALASPLNKNQVHDSYEKYLKPLMHAARL